MKTSERLAVAGYLWGASRGKEALEVLDEGQPAKDPVIALIELGLRLAASHQARP